MNTQHKFGAGITALAVGTVVIFPAVETAAAVHRAHRWRDPCPAVDDVPICGVDWQLTTPLSGSDGTKVVALPTPTETSTASIDSIGLGCRGVPWLEVVSCPQ
jgi:hypothetical protein